MRSIWEIADTDETITAGIVESAKIPPLLAQCLVNRGFTESAAVDDFLNPKLARLSDPFLLPNMRTGVERLFAAREAGERLLIFGDYDVDGVTSCTILNESLSALGWQTATYLPHRMDEGYGLSLEAAKKCIAENRPQLLLAADCGSTNIDSIEWINEQNVDVLVLDHHQVPQPAPAAHALINPQLAADDEPDFRELCTAGLAFKLLHAIVKEGRARGIAEMEKFDIRQFLDLVALGTIADLVPLIRENRILAVNGLKQLNATNRLGLQALTEAARIKGPIGGFEVGFQLGPRLNAAGRLESATEALDLLQATDADTAHELAGKLDRRNRDRQLTEREMTTQVLDVLRLQFDPENDFAIVQGDARWHPGMVGIVASRVQKEFYRPTLIIGGGPDGLRGSGRSVQGFDLAAALRECSEYLESGGGHAMAAGLSLQPEQLKDFTEKFMAIAQRQLKGGKLMPTLRLDASVPLRQLTMGAVDSLLRLQPTGQGVGPVQVAVPQVELNAPVRWMGKEKQHAKLLVTDGNVTAEVLCWNAKDKPLPDGRFDLAVEPGINVWRGKRSLQLKMLDWRSAG